VQSPATICQEMRLLGKSPGKSLPPIWQRSKAPTPANPRKAIPPAEGPSASPSPACRAGNHACGGYALQRRESWPAPLRAQSNRW